MQDQALVEDKHIMGGVKSNISRETTKIWESKARVKSFVIGTRDEIQEPLIMTGTFLINHLYGELLSYSKVEKSFMNPELRHIIRHKSSTL